MPPRISRSRTRTEPRISLAGYRGRTVVLYFYPRDQTPGCTIQACSFRDSHAEVLAEGAVVLGVSTDDADSHVKFRERHGLPFPLLVDTEAAVAARYGAWGEKVLYGRRYQGMTPGDVHHRTGWNPDQSLETCPAPPATARRC